MTQGDLEIPYRKQRLWESDMEENLESHGPSIIEVMEFTDSQEEEDINEVAEKDITDTDDAFVTPTPALTIGEVLSRLPKKKNGKITIVILMLESLSFS